MTYRITIDAEACEGVFACLVRDDRFVEGEDGLAKVDDAAADVRRTPEGDVRAVLADDRIEDARRAAAACPPGAIDVEEVSESEATGAPRDMLARHPETAYFWGRVAGDGELAGDCVTVRATDETAARRLAAIAGADRVDHRIREREYAHDTAVTRTADEYAVQVFGDLARRAGASLGLPVDGDPGGYRLDVFRDQRRQLLRGLLEGCGTVCYKSDTGAVGVSFVHDDRALLDRIGSVLADLPVDAPRDDVAETSSGGYWFGLADEAVPAFGRWVYEGSEETGLFAPSRRRKLRRSLAQART